MSRDVFGEVVVENLKQMEQWIGGLAVVTGATGGIGAAICSKLVKAGVIVVGIARQLEKLDELSEKLLGEKGTFHPRECDVTKEEEILETFEWVEESLGPISILINAAGLQKPTNLKDGDSEIWKNSFDVNVLGLCICTREALKSMRNHGIDGQIIHINCVTGRIVPELPESMLNVWPATKHAVTAITEIFRKELVCANSKIKVSSISPGITATEIYDDHPEDVAEYLEDISKLKPGDVANAVAFVLGTPAEVHVQDIVIKAVGERI